MKKKLFLIISAILVIASIIYLVVINTGKEDEKTITDAEKFKTEYESINGDVNEKYNVVTREVNIPRNNPIVVKPNASPGVSFNTDTNNASVMDIVILNNRTPNNDNNIILSPWRKENVINNTKQNKMNKNVINNIILQRQ